MANRTISTGEEAISAALYSIMPNAILLIMVTAYEKTSNCSKEKWNSLIYTLEAAPPKKKPVGRDKIKRGKTEIDFLVVSGWNMNK